MFKFITSLFNKQPLVHPHHTASYAVTCGAFVGEILIYVCSSMTHHCFLSIPSMVNRNIPKEKFDFGLKNGILEHVKSLPADVFATVEQQYQKNEPSN